MINKISSINTDISYNRRKREYLDNKSFTGYSKNVQHIPTQIYSIDGVMKSTTITTSRINTLV